MCHFPSLVTRKTFSISHVKKCYKFFNFFGKKQLTTLTRESNCHEETGINLITFVPSSPCTFSQLANFLIKITFPLDLICRHYKLANKPASAPFQQLLIFFYYTSPSCYHCYYCCESSRAICKNLITSLDYKTPFNFFLQLLPSSSLYSLSGFSTPDPVITWIASSLHRLRFLGRW